VKRTRLIAVAATMLVAFLAPASAQLAHAVPAAAAESHGLIVATDRGLVEGKVAEGTDQFLGIPYAAPPTGALRWEAPQPMPRWRGIRQATSYGGRCAQLASGNGPRVDNEDCLYLNVYTPPDANGAGRLPVLFMIHGGGLTTGAGDQHDGSLIVTTDHIIVVCINYRLGPFGFLDVPVATVE
jgi:carboxylesterase type B